jgi:hypothetical protein
VKNVILAIIVLSAIACARGRRGHNGTDGDNGSPGIGCSVEQVVNGAIVTCGTTTAIILDGAAGEDGQDANGTYAVIEIVKPCADTGSKEVLFRLASGDVVAHYSHGSKQYLAILSPGTYNLTDGTQCAFTLYGDGTITW